MASGDWIALAGFVALFAMIALRVPIGVAMGLVGVFGFASIRGINPALNLLATSPIRVIADFNLSLVPFFILMGIQVKLESFLSWPVVSLAGGLLVAAVVGKVACGLGARSPANRLIVGVGMLPRGEVGLVFAAIGRALGVLDDALFSAIVLMVIVTTLIAPPWLKAVIRRQPASAEEASA